MMSDFYIFETFEHHICKWTYPDASQLAIGSVAMPCWPHLTLTCFTWILSKFLFICHFPSRDARISNISTPLSHFQEKSWSIWVGKTFSHFKMVPSQPCRVSLLLDPISRFFVQNLQLYQNDSRPKLGKILCGGGLDSFLVKPSIIWETSVGRVLVCTVLFNSCGSVPHPNTAT